MKLPQSESPQLLRVAREQHVPLQASKWLALQFLVDADELARLFEEMGDFGIYLAGVVLGRDEGRVPHDVFLEHYTGYIAQLQKGQLPDEHYIRGLFSSALSVDPGALCSVEIGDTEQIIRPQRPVVQLQMHKIGYSSIDHKFRPMVLGDNAIYWGMQASYPQIFRNPETGKIENVTADEAFPNTALFRVLQKWIRKNTLPTPFVVEGVRTNVPMRLGRRCFAWIGQHPQLIEKGVSVLAPKNRVES